MKETLHVGFTTLPNAPWETTARQWRYLEALGFDSLWTCDHFVNPLDASGPWFEGWTQLAALATQTVRVQIGVLVTNMAFRNPALLAREAMTVDHVSGGRLRVGLGCGDGADRSYRMMGLPEFGPAERVARFREVVEIIDRMLRQRVTTYHGRYYDVEQACVVPASVQTPRPDLTLAAHGPAMLRIAAQYADTWNTFPSPWLAGRHRLDAVRRHNDAIDEACLRIGRHPRDVRRSLMAYPAPPDNPFASVQAFEDYVGQYRELGFEEFIFFYPEDCYQPATGQETRVVEQVAVEVLPRLKAQTYRPYAGT